MVTPYTCCKQHIQKLILIPLLFIGTTLFAQAPVADFVASATSGCGVTVIIFEDISTNNPTSLTWNFGIGGNQTPELRADRKYSYIYSTPGTYTVRLTATNASGSNTVEKVAHIRIYAKPTANFSIAQTALCQGDELQFNDISTSDVAITSWAWNFGDGNVSTLQNPTHTYANTGTFSVFLSITNANGCDAFYNNATAAVITTKPTASFTASATESCTAPFTTTFSSATSVGPITSYLWNFGDGQTSTEANPSHTYTSSGNYSVSLRVRTASNCEHILTQTDLIKIGTFTAGIQIADNTVCRGTAAQFTDASSVGVVARTWDFGDGSPTSIIPNPIHTYTTAGTYTVTINSQNGAGCTDTHTESITVLDLPTPTFTESATTACAVPFTVNFTNTTANTASASWNFGDGGTSAQANPSHTYNAMGNYNITLQVTDNNGCVNTSIFPNHIRIRIPQVNFASSTLGGCAPLPVTFTDLSTSNNPITSWAWVVQREDGAITLNSTNQNPLITLTDTGSYNVTLTVIDNAGCTNTLTRNDFVGAGMTPTADFQTIPTTVCFNTPMDFEDLAEPWCNNWIWDFGDGTTQSGKNPTYVYADTGTYTVTLIAEHYHCPDIAVKIDYVTILPPIARYSIAPTVLCSFPDTIQFTNESVLADEYYWDFGDGMKLSIIGDTWTWTNGVDPDVVETIVGNKSPEYEYTVAGNYISKLRVVNTTFSCEDSTEVAFTASDVVPDFVQDKNSTCQHTGVSFTDISTTDLGTITAWEWDFGDGTPAVTLTGTPTHNFAISGDFDVTLIAFDSNGCRDTITKVANVTIYEVPSVQFTADRITGCAPLTVDFTDASTATLPDSVVTWNWVFGDGNTLQIDENLDNTYTWTYNGVVTETNAVSKNPNHIFVTRGSYPTILTITDSRGCDSTKTITITPSKPYPSFTVAPTTCHYNAVVFTNTSTGQTVNEWDFDDASGISNAINPSHNYAITNDQTFTVSLRVIDGNMCDSTTSTTITVRHPIADFSTTDVLIPCWSTGSATMTNASSSALGTINAHNWLFEDIYNPFSNTSTEVDPVYQFRGPGINDVRLTVTDDFGCTDVLLRPDYIEVGGPQGTYTFTPIESCSPSTITFTANAVNTTKYNWFYGNTNQTEDSPLSQIEYEYTTGNIYTTALVLADDNGCTSQTITAANNVTVYQVTPDFEADITISCQDTIIQFTDLSESLFTITNWSWNLGNGTNSTLQNPTANYTTGLYTVSLTATAGNCDYTNSKTQYIGIYEMPDASFTITKNPARMLETLRFINTSDSTSMPITWHWDLGDGEEATTTNVTRRYDYSGTYPIILTASTHPQCMDTATVDLIITNEVYIPNAFSPNKDGVNDIYLEGMNLPTIILNRWGQTLYEGIAGWDGTFEGKEMTSGTYFYIVTLPNGETHKGPVTLIR